MPLPIDLCLDRRPRIHRRAPDCACYLAEGHAGLHMCGHPMHGGWA